MQVILEISGKLLGQLNQIGREGWASGGSSQDEQFCIDKAIEEFIQKYTLTQITPADIATNGQLIQRSPPKYIHLTPKEIEAVVKMYCDHIPISKIAEKYNTSWVTINNHLKREGVYLSRKDRGHLDQPESVPTESVPTEDYSDVPPEKPYDTEPGDLTENEYKKKVIAKFKELEDTQAVARFYKITIRLVRQILHDADAFSIPAKPAKPAPIEKECSFDAKGNIIVTPESKVTKSYNIDVDKIIAKANAKKVS